jgi:hypothetical protein
MVKISHKSVSIFTLYTKMSAAGFSETVVTTLKVLQSGGPHIFFQLQEYRRLKNFDPVILRLPVNTDSILSESTDSFRQEQRIEKKYGGYVVTPTVVFLWELLPPFLSLLAVFLFHLIHSAMSTCSWVHSFICILLSMRRFLLVRTYSSLHVLICIHRSCVQPFTSLCPSQT